jgi:Domain of unknown function (DUF5658)
MGRPSLVGASIVMLCVSPWFAREAGAQENVIPTALGQPLQAAEDGQAPISLTLPRPVTAGVDLTQPSKSPGGSNALMTSLYASTATMQVLDVHSTFKALDRGATEVNPMMSGLVENRAAFITMKVAMAAAAIYAASRVARHNKAAAVVTLVAMNSAYAMIVSNNYRIAAR